jgi:hypothetical protein
MISSELNHNWPGPKSNHGQREVSIIQKAPFIAQDIQQKLMEQIKIKNLQNFSDITWLPVGKDIGVFYVFGD